MNTLRNFILAGACLTLAVLALGCGDEAGGGGGSAQGCDACASGEVCVAYLGAEDEEEREECAAAPAACGATPTCEVDACRGALYGLCDEEWIGVGCSDTFPPPIVSCNPSR